MTILECNCFTRTSSQRRDREKAFHEFFLAGIRHEEHGRWAFVGSFVPFLDNWFSPCYTNSQQLTASSSWTGNEKFMGRILRLGDRDDCYKGWEVSWYRSLNDCCVILRYIRSLNIFVYQPISWLNIINQYYPSSVLPTLGQSKKFSYSISVVFHLFLALSKRTCIGLILVNGIHNVMS